MVTPQHDTDDTGEYVIHNIVVIFIHHYVHSSENSETARAVYCHLWYVLNVCTVKASRTVISDQAGARKLGNASIGMSIAGIVVSVVIIIIVVAVSVGARDSSSTDDASSYSSSCVYNYLGTCYRYRSYVGTYGSCSGVRSSSGYCYYN